MDVGRQLALSSRSLFQLVALLVGLHMCKLQVLVLNFVQTSHELQSSVPGTWWRLEKDDLHFFQAFPRMWSAQEENGWNGMMKDGVTL